MSPSRYKTGFIGRAAESDQREGLVERGHAQSFGAIRFAADPATQPHSLGDITQLRTLLGVRRRGGRVWWFCGRPGILGVSVLGTIEDSDSAVPSRIRSLDASSERTPIGDGRTRRSSYGRPRCTSFVLS